MSFSTEFLNAKRFSQRTFLSPFAGSTYGVLQLFSSTVVVSIDSEERPGIVLPFLPQDSHTLVFKTAAFHFLRLAFLANNHHSLF